MPAPNITLLCVCFGPMLIGLVLNTLLYGVRVLPKWLLPPQGAQPPTDHGHPNAQVLPALPHRPHMDTLFYALPAGYRDGRRRRGVRDRVPAADHPVRHDRGRDQIPCPCCCLVVSPVLSDDSLQTISTPRFALDRARLRAGPAVLRLADKRHFISRSYVLPVIISILALGSFALGVTTCVRVIVAARFVNFSMLEHTTAAWLITTCVCDIVLAAGMARALLSRKTGFAHVDSQINRIVRLSIESGSITAAVAILDLAFALGFKHRAINFIVDFPLSTLYTCSVLALMNSRQPGERGRSGSRSGDAERGAGRSVNVLSSSGHGSSGTRPPAPMSFALGSMGGSEGNMKYVHAEVYDGRGKAV
ncbi:hypothetical protein MIND_01269200 [Mycena indigotica]|uniref:DUF6534 domain-containing protein n=1 Tax=Mycena indigotica TaxID=2126181 RepID=A0A8H6VRL8_9AGAR|nr:uncharacterized protein MIND_01269200 [Mycena indigotica]KAF7291254.1 hypothetical protein MIND_01269200 [Mycena indigotica]